jgi:hypothetical protein
MAHILDQILWYYLVGLYKKKHEITINWSNQIRRSDQNNMQKNFFCQNKKNDEDQFYVNLTWKD